MQTIPKNRTAPIIDSITAIQSFTLDNGFIGRPVEDLDWAKDFLKRTQPKISFDKYRGYGVARMHSNAWYEFQVLPPASSGPIVSPEVS